jgi:hypothetical protein
LSGKETKSLKNENINNIFKDETIGTFFGDIQSLFDKQTLTVK